MKNWYTASLSLSKQAFYSEIETPFEVKKYVKNKSILNQIKNLQNQGIPLYYHSTNKSFDTFGVTVDIGYHFGEFNAAASLALSEGWENYKILIATLDMNNTLDMTNAQDPIEWNVVSALVSIMEDVGAPFTDEEIEIMKQYEENTPNDRSNEAMMYFKQLIIDKGYDSVEYVNANEGYGSKSWIVFKPSQIHILGNMDMSEIQLDEYGKAK